MANLLLQQTAHFLFSAAGQARCSFSNKKCFSDIDNHHHHHHLGCKIVNEHSTYVSTFQCSKQATELAWENFSFFKKGPTLASFMVYFRSFQTNIITEITTNICEKYPSSLQCRDSNPRPSEHESPPITTRPGHLFICLCSAFSNNFTAKNVKNWVVVVAQLVERLL